MFEINIAKVKKDITTTERLIKKSEIKYLDTIKALKMEIQENKELGNCIIANQPWIEYALVDKRAMEKLKKHKEKLLNIINK